MIALDANALDAAALEVQDAVAVRTALSRFVQHGVDLHDCLIVGQAEQRKARVVAFEAKTAKRLGMDVLR